MRSPSPHTFAKNAAKELVREAKSAGWERVKLEIKPDGCLTLNAGMEEIDGQDDFFDCEMRMGK